MRVRSTQKFPIVERSATDQAADQRDDDGHARPAADTKFCTVRPSHLGEVAHASTRRRSDCQFVFVTKLTAVLNDR